MAITYYASRENNNSAVLNDPVGTLYLPTQEKEKNVGGLIGGIGYLGEKLAVGTVSSIEGIVDYLGSGFAKMFGRDDWAENIIANDWFGDWYSHPEQWYNPGQGWQVAGDVAGGIGTSIPGMAASIGAAVLTGGASLVAQGVATAGASFLTSGLGAAGRSTKEAYQQSGELTGKEFGYGALSGLTEGGIEAVSNLIGMGSGAVVKSFTKALGKETAEAFTKQGIVKTLGKSFLGEAFEESASEILDPYWKRLTYDPNAKNATADEVLYAGFVGGLSGMVMGGTSYGIDATKSYIGGNRLAQRGGEAEVLDTAADLAAFENENQTGDELFTEIVSRREELSKSLEATGGRATTVLQQRELGALERANVAATAKMFVAKRAQNIVNNVDQIVERLNSYGYKKADGTPITYTREQILEGYDPKRPQSIYKALKDNVALRSLAVADATGRLIMDTAKFKEATLTGQMLASQVDLNRFVETATPQEVAAVSKALGIERWSDLTAEEFNQKIAEFVENGGVERSVQENERKNSFEAIGTEKAQGVPRIVNLGKDGVRRYTDGKLDIGVERRGDEYTVYDYNNKTLSRSMSREEVNSVFREYAKRNAGESSADIAAVTPESREHAAKVEEIKKFQSDVREIDKLARDKVKGYSKLSDASKGMIRKLIREGRAKGVPEADILMYANISARSGIDIQFDKEACYRGVKDDGSPDYADGFYEASQNRIVVNPDGKRSAERLIIHELDHAIRKFFDKKGKKATRIYFEAIEGVSPEVREKIAKEYKKTAKPGEAAALVMDETNAYYAEQVLGNKYTLEKLLEEEPTLKEKILSFFKAAGKDYADVPKLSGAAKKYYRTYKKLFDEFSARNAENNATEKPLTSMKTENMQDSGRDYASNIKNQTKIYDYKKPFSEQVDDYKNGKIPKGDSLLIGGTPKVLKNIGLNALPMTINQTHVDYAINGTKNIDHSIGEALLKQLPTALEKPVAIITSKTANATSLVEIISIQHNGNQIVVPIYIDGLGRQNGIRIDSNAVTSVHSRKNAITSLLTDAIKDEVSGKIGIYYWNKNKALALLSGGKVTMPNLPNTLSDGFIHSIHENSSPVKPKLKNVTESQQFKRWFGKSKAVNADGTPMILYHQTSEYFTVFEPRHKGAGTNDSETPFGIFLKPDDSDIGLKGKKQMALYARITTPLEVNSRYDLRKTLEKLSPEYAKIMSEEADLAAEYEKKIENASQAQLDYARKYREDHPNAVRSDIYNDSKFEELLNAEEAFIEEWGRKGDELAIRAKEEITKVLKEKGYDGVHIKNDEGSWGRKVETYIALEPDQVKSAKDNIGTYSPYESDINYALDIDSGEGNISGANVMGWLNKKPKSEGKLNLEETVARGLPYKRGKSDLTVGELRKTIANTTHEKVYSKSDALKAVNKLSGTWGLTVKARDEIADTVWQFLNEAPDIEYRQDMAHDIAEYIVAKVLMDSKTENPDALEAAERLSYLRTGVGKLSFSDEDIVELRHALDDKGLKRLMGRWGFKGTKKSEGTSGGYVATRRIPMDIFVTSVAREMPGMEYLEEMHPAEAFLKIDKAYSKAYADSKDKWISQYWDMPDSEIPAMVKDVEDGIMSAFDTFGEKSKFTKLLESKIESYQKRADRFKAERDEIKGRDRVLGLLMNQATKMKNLKMGTYANATQHDSDVLRGSVERLASIQFRGNLNVSGTRNIVAELRLWYNPKNSMLEYVDEQNPGYYSKGISDMLDAIADGEGGFSKDELLTLYDIMAYFTNFVENYGKVWRKGQWVDAEVEAKRYVNTLQTNEQLKVGPVRRLLGSRYMQTFGDPMTVARRMDMHESGFFTEMLEELREGAMGAQVAEMEILEDYDKFLTENRKYIEKTATERIIYQGVEVPKMHLIGLYMTLKRKHSRPGLAENGFAFYDTDGKKVRVNGFALDMKDITEAEIDKRSDEQLSLIASKLTEKDMEYIKILEKAYNEDARRLKAERDIQRLGFTNAGRGYYYPIRRGNIAKNVDSSEYMAELDRVSNSSFNKNTVKGARQELYIENADVVFRRHVRAVTQYSYLSPAIEAYNRLYNLDVGGNPNQPISVATESANTWDKGNAYFKKLIADIQGIPPVSGEGTEILSKMRSGYAKYQLGANPKVWFTQLSSLFASTSLLDADSIARGANISAEGMDEYCPLAKLRNSENTAAIAQAVLDTRGKKVASGIDRLSDLLMAPIGKVDRFVVGRLFAASQVQVEKNGGAKVGTEENKIAAGKLLTEVILETQQNSIATERSAAMRSGNEILRTATMFSADSMKVTGRVLDSLGEALTLKARIKVETDSDKIGVLNQRLETANKQLGKSMAAMVSSAVYMACIAQLFRHIYNKDKDEDKSTAEIMMADVMSNMIGGLPLVRDVYTKLFEGYDISNYSYSAINDLLDSASSLASVAGDIFSGKAGAEEKNRAIRNLINSLGQLSGLPTRNAYNVIFGLTKRFSPTTAFAIDSLFYKKNYQTELNKAIERGDSKMASYIFGLMAGERLDDDMDQSVFDELLRLTKSNYKVLPKSMPDSIKLGDVEYTVSDGEREAMQNIYSGYDDAVSKLIASNIYTELTDENKALVIDYVSDLYYSKAKSEVLGTEEKKAAKLIDVLKADVLAAYYLKTKGLDSDVDDEGNTVSGSKRVKVVSAINSLKVSSEQKLLLICASGYSIKDGDIRGVSADVAKTRLLKYILNLRGISAEEKAEIAEMCGFEVKNGKIVNNFAKNVQKISKK